MSKRLIVMKFGGTSVGNAARFRQCAEIIGQAAQQDRIIVVVSAMAGVTDLIFKAIEAARHADTTATEACLKRFGEVHRELVCALLDNPRCPGALEFVEGICTQLQRACHALSALRSDISAQTTDSLVALGERISSWVLANYLQQLGIAGEHVRAEDVIITDGNFGNASPDMEATRSASQSVLLPLLQAGAIPVVAGYSGASPDGRSTTLGRGGSDYSATILGAACGADEVG